jgi:hypothetical protein
MKAFAALFIAVLFSLNVLAHETRPTPTPDKPSDFLLGTWVSEHPIHNRDVKIYTEFTFAENDMKLTATCVYHYQNTQLSVSVASDVIYVGNRIQVLENTQGSVNDGYRYCNAGLKPSVWEFYFDGTGRAVLFVPTPYQQRFNLIRVEDQALRQP